MTRKSATALALSKGEKVSYSPFEQRLFQIIPKDGRRIDTKRLAAHYYARLGPPPYNGQKSVVDALSSLMTKVSINKEPFKVCKSERRGPRPLEVWLEAA